MSLANGLVCRGCDARYPIAPMWHGCGKCVDRAGDPHWLEVEYDLEKLDASFLCFGRLWDYADLLPPSSAAAGPTLGEGGTPLLFIPELNDELGLPGLHLKLETRNPTATFKDRLHAVSMSMAKQFGATHAAIVTTGNSGVAAAAMAARAGIKLAVITDPTTPVEHLRMMKLFGAAVTVPGKRGPVVLQAAELMRSLVEEHNFYPCAVQGTYSGFGNPYGVEGYATIAYEVTAQLGGAPDRFLAPTAGGDALYGPFLGFKRLADAGLARLLPRMTACQAEGADYVVKAVAAGADHFTPIKPATEALSIGDPVGSTSILRAIEMSSGTALGAPDEDLFEVLAALGRFGICVEAASAAPVAAARRAVQTGELEVGETMVALLTGTGMRWPAQVDRAIGQSPTLPDDANVIAEKLGA